MYYPLILCGMKNFSQRLQFSSVRIYRQLSSCSHLYKSFKRVGSEYCRNYRQLLHNEMRIQGNRGVTPSTELPRLLMTFLTLVTDGCRFSGTVSGVGTVGAIILEICRRHFRYKRSGNARSVYYRSS